MATSIRRVDYFYTTVADEPGEAYGVLHSLADLGVNLVAISAVPIGPNATQLQIFPDESRKLSEAARHAKLPLVGPQPAILVQGDDELGALANVHARLADADVNIYASNAVADGRGAFGCVIYLRPEDFDRGAKILGV